MSGKGTSATGANPVRDHRHFPTTHLLPKGALPKHRRRSCQSITITTRSRPFERISKRRKGFPSETRVKRSRKGHLRTIRGGEIELVEKLGRNDPCPCGSGKSFQAVLPAIGPVRRCRAARLLAVSGFAAP
ncbi:SEC-C metal-binding domain-containing protein [Qipengyuania sp. DSG2-2]|uniref:SEC-C metal-binding domain-containing protein n=1 Tax=Qipengyuania sp. DGS2-2 TaxID=3349631 RepID=UPI0036D38D5D